MPALLVETRLGWFWAVARNGGWIAASLAANRDAAAEQLRSFGEQAATDDLAQRLAEEMMRYAAGEPVDFSRCPVDLSGQPPFWRRAQLAARTIPYREVRTYAWLAQRAGNPKAVRAAGQAMAHNPISPIIPCHRVIASDGSLGGYGGGLPLKRALLELEGGDLWRARAGPGR